MEQQVYVITPTGQSCTNKELHIIKNELNSHHPSNEFKFVTGDMLNDVMMFSAILETHLDSVIVLNTEHEHVFFHQDSFYEILNMLNQYFDEDTFDVLCKYL
ncbi:MAG: hypothetical protein MJ105_07005 [Lachnospiraceae bacterium]|nr:hypothetical protein [Lachnospiraceae bacterium]